VLGGVITAYLDHAFVSLPAAADFAVSAGRCGCPASVSARLRRCSAARRSCAGHSHGGSTVHLQCWRSRSLELRCCDFVVLTYSGADPKRLNERLAPEVGGRLEANDTGTETGNRSFIRRFVIRLSLLANVNSRSRSLYAFGRPSVVCNVRAPYSGGSNFRQYFYGTGYLGHPMTFSENFMEIVPGEPLRRGS